MQYAMTDSPKRAQKVHISWTLLTLPDGCCDKPDERDEGFWPSLDPDAAGYIGDPDPTDIDGRAYEARFSEAMGAAERRMAAWQSGEWEYIGVVAKAVIFIPIGGDSFRIMELRSGGLWGVESDAGDYLQTIFNDEREQLLAELRTLGRALGTEPDYDEELPE